MEAISAQGIRVKVFEGELKECQKKANEWFAAPDSEAGRILDVSLGDHAILVVYTLTQGVRFG